MDYLQTWITSESVDRFEYPSVWYVRMILWLVCSHHEQKRKGRSKMRGVKNAMQNPEKYYYCHFGLFFYTKKIVCFQENLHLIKFWHAQ